MTDTPKDTVTFIVPDDEDLAATQYELTSLAAVLGGLGFHPDFDPSLPLRSVEPGTVCGNDAFSHESLTDLALVLSDTFANVPFKLYSDPAERYGTWSLGSLYRYRPGLGLHPGPGEHIACDGNGNAYISADQIRDALTEGPTRVDAVLGTAWSRNGSPGPIPSTPATGTPVAAPAPTATPTPPTARRSR